MGNMADLDKYFKLDAATGRYVSQLSRRDILPGWLAFTNASSTDGSYTIKAATNPLSSSPPVQWKQPYFSLQGVDDGYGAPFEVKYIMFSDTTDLTPNANFLMELTEIGETRKFMNRPQHVLNICGTAQTPALLREPYLLTSQHDLQATFTKISGGATNVQMPLAGVNYAPWSPNMQFYPERKKEVVDALNRKLHRKKFVTPFWLTTDTDVNLTSLQSQDYYSKIGDDGHFEAFTITAVSTGSFSLQISEVKTRQTLMNGSVTKANATGSANFPSVLAFPYLIPAGYRLRFTITDLSGSNNMVYLTLAGRKIYAPFRDIESQLATKDMPMYSKNVPAKSIYSI